jgi:hypothetical protein
MNEVANGHALSSLSYASRGTPQYEIKQPKTSREGPANINPHQMKPSTSLSSLGVTAASKKQVIKSNLHSLLIRN